MKYTFVFEKSEEKIFRNQLAKIDSEWYNIIEDIYEVEKDEKGKLYYSPTCQCVIDMDEMDALSYFRMPMGNSVKIRRERTAEEQAAEDALEAKNKVTIKVVIPGQNQP